MKKIKTKYLILVLAVYILAISLTGCKKCIEKFDSTVQVEIVNEYYKPEQIIIWIQEVVSKENGITLNMKL